jgi:hypothetical protein
MHKHVLIITFAALCVTISAANATPVAGLQTAIEQQDSHEGLLQPVTWGYRHHHFGPYGYYYRPYYYFDYDYYAPWYGDRYSYWKPRWHRHWY